MKLVKQKYFSASGEEKVNCYKLNISKKLLEAAKINENDDLEAYVKADKIIIKKRIKKED